jgi:hypothetical protein
MRIGRLMTGWEMLQDVAVGGKADDGFNLGMLQIEERQLAAIPKQAGAREGSMKDHEKSDLSDCINSKWSDDFLQHVAHDVASNPPPCPEFTCAQYCTQTILLHLTTQANSLQANSPDYSHSMHSSILVCFAVNPTVGRLLSNSLMAWG